VVILSIVAAVVGGGARLGLAGLSTESTNVVVPALGEPLDIGVVEPPEMLFADFRFTDGSSTQAYHVNLADERFFVIVEPTDAAPVEIVKRDDGTFLARLVGETAWSAFGQPEGLDAAAADIREVFSNFVTLSDALPRAVIPFVTVLLEEDQPLPQLADSTGSPETLYRHYRLQVDLAAFRQADVAAYASWFSVALISDDGRFDIWVDSAGVVRRVEALVDGDTSAMELLGWSNSSERFAQPFVMAPQVLAPPPSDVAGG
jgi:hypothetical protein